LAPFSSITLKPSLRVICHVLSTLLCLLRRQYAKTGCLLTIFSLHRFNQPHRVVSQVLDSWVFFEHGFHPAGNSHRRNGLSFSVKDCASFRNARPRFLLRVFETSNEPKKGRSWIWFLPSFRTLYRLCPRSHPRSDPSQDCTPRVRNDPAPPVAAFLLFPPR